MVALLAGGLLMSGCSDEKPEEPPVAASSETPDPAYDGSLEPSAAVLALVPEDARTLTVTDFDQVRLELGADGLGAESTPEELAAFWQRAEQERPMLTTGLLRPEEGRLGTTYGVTQVDVAWEAHFYGADDDEMGWVLRFRDGSDMAKVAEAASEGAGVLSGAVVDAGEHLVSSGTTDDPAQSWAVDPETVAMVGLPANATYVARGCVDDESAGDVDDLAVYALQFEGSLVTARLGKGRHDLFTRMRLGAGEPTFTQAFNGGVADPRTGRIGYVMSDPAAAARLALGHQLPFATCA